MKTRKHSFAKAWLKKLGYNIYINDVDYFSNVTENYLQKTPIKPLHTRLKIGVELLDDSEMEEISILPYKEMQEKFKLTVYRLSVDSSKGRYGWTKNQKYVYIIGQKKPGGPEVPEGTFSRRGFRIEWDKKNKAVRGVGEGFGTYEGQFAGGDITPWIRYGEPDKKRPLNFGRVFTRESFDSITDDLLDVWDNKPLRKNQFVEIKEVPIMITEEGELLCLPKTKVLPKILIVGKTGKGKSWTLNSMLGRIFYQFQDRIGLLNDSLNQFYDLMLPMEQIGFIKELERIGNEPRPLPTINLYMSCPKLKIRYAEEHIGYRLVIPFKDFLYRYKFFTHEVPKWDLGKPEKYLTKELVHALDRCKSARELRDTMYAVIPNAHEDKGAQAMIYKWQSAFDGIFRDEFTSNLFTHEKMTAPYWVVDDGKTKQKGHPFIVSMEAGLIPVINNYLAKSNPIAKKQMSDLINQIVRWQMEKEDDKRRMWIFVDELKDFLGKKNDDLYTALDYLFTQGRINKLGFVGNVQEYTKLSSAMKANSSHLVIFELQTSEERNAIAKDYGLDKTKLIEIANLKTFQCLFTTKEKMVIYDKGGRRKIVEGGLWRGKIVPPITGHISP